MLAGAWPGGPERPKSTLVRRPRPGLQPADVASPSVPDPALPAGPGRAAGPDAVASPVPGPGRGAVHGRGRAVLRQQHRRPRLRRPAEGPGRHAGHGPDRRAHAAGGRAREAREDHRRARSPALEVLRSQDRAEARPGHRRPLRRDRRVLGHRAQDAHRHPPDRRGQRGRAHGRQGRGQEGRVLRARVAARGQVRARARRAHQGRGRQRRARRAACAWPSSAARPAWARTRRFSWPTSSASSARSCPTWT
jgi:hypothetical protein